MVSTSFLPVQMQQGAIAKTHQAPTAIYRRDTRNRSAAQAIACLFIAYPVVTSLLDFLELQDQKEAQAESRKELLIKVSPCAGSDRGSGFLGQTDKRR